ncbi:unnamed protein product [Cylindrotheca closterium]|uniref:Uncharacterized protein n=1 Tax=Cylindrotheca closterium TaxID=2856 RepID=A0AAD2GD64_9STRA|nr:unnamed protein product [Cylindrotheca closterium]
MTNASGLAASIRGSTESSTFDLGGQNVTTITNNITSAFQDPLPIQEMIRITFVTGAGKLGRQKYDADAAKAVTSALRDLGFEDDRGASCVKECAASFKLQHDTGKNLKTVVVFPRIQEDDAPASGDGTGSNQASTVPVIAKGSVEDLIVSTSNAVFKNMTKSKCPSWSEKKECMGALSNIKTMLEELDQKLVTGTPLTDGEQEFYDSVSSDSLDEKQGIVKDLMHSQVEEGGITSREKKQLLSQVSERLEKVSAELEEAEGKKAEKLNGMKAKLEARKEMLSGITPKPLPKLKHETEILTLRAELLSLSDVVDAAAGRLLSLKESKALARKEEVEEEIADFEQKSRGWFEDDESFEERVNSLQGVAASRPKKGAAKKPASKSHAPAWIATSSSTKKTQSKSKAGKSKNSGGAGGVFAAMMMDSDSD